MTENGFIKLHRSLLEWEWHDDESMLSLFIHCLMLANWKDGRYHGRLIPRGSFVTSNQHLANITGLSKTTVHRCLHKLQETGEISLKVERFYTIVSVRNYAVFQQSDDEGWNASGTQMEHKRNTNGTQTEPIEESKKVRKKEVIKKNTKRKRKEILPDYWNPNPIREENLTPATEEEIEEVRRRLKGESKDEIDRR